MLIETGYDLSFDVPAPTPMHLLLHAYPNRYLARTPETHTVTPNVPLELFYDTFGNRCTRLLAPAGKLHLAGHAVYEVDGQPDLVNPQAVQHPVLQLPYDVLPFLVASRYCETDRLAEFAWATFGNGPTGYPRAHAVCQFVHNHLTFGYEHARNTRTAYEAWAERKGVCRDFAHLSVALCRCLGIPARYATGYLGDIGVPFNPAPMDFSAWFEVYLSGTWYTLDARHNHPRIGRIVMAQGRDAADAALTTSFGPTTLTRFEVRTREV